MKDIIAEDEKKWQLAPEVANENRAFFEIAAKYCRDVGLLLEFGVWTGTSVQAIDAVFNGWSSNSSPTIVYGFDSWLGLPEDGGHFQKGMFDAHGIPPEIDNPNIVLVNGWFEDTLPKFSADHFEPIRFVSIDCDIYSSTKTVFKNLLAHFVAGTVIYFDEFRFYSGWETQEYLAFLEFIRDTGWDYDYLGKSANGERTAVILKERK
jgi:hypothetical protein